MYIIVFKLHIIRPSRALTKLISSVNIIYVDSAVFSNISAQIRRFIDFLRTSESTNHIA